jgi:hypothetical protein
MHDHPEKENFEEKIKKDWQADSSLKELTDLVMESLEESYRMDWEPFEIYAQKLKSHIHSNPASFHQRFAEGYEHLIEVLHHTKSHLNE